MNDWLRLCCGICWMDAVCGRFSGLAVVLIDCPASACENADNSNIRSQPQKRVINDSLVSLRNRSIEVTPSLIKVLGMNFVGLGAQAVQ